MTHIIEKDESVANQRTLHFRLFTSDGTTPDTTASGDSIIVARGSATTFVPDVLVVAVHAAQGMYSAVLTASNVSNLGPHAIYHTQGSFPQHVVNFDVVNFNPYSNFSNIAAKTYSGVTVGSAATILAGTYSGVTVGINNIAAGTYSGVTIGGSSFVTINPGTYSNVTFSAGGLAPSLVTLAPGTHSSATVQGVTTAVNLTTNNDKTGYTIAAGDYSSTVTFGVDDIKPGTYSGVTLGVNNIAAGNYSGVTISGVTATNVLDKTAYGVTSIAAGTYSGVTVGSAATILAGTYSGVTLGVNNIAAGNYSGVTISGVTATNVLDKTAYGVTSIAAGTYSGVTVGSAATILPGAYSGVTVGIDNIASGTIQTADFAAAALDATVFATDAEQAFADRLLLRSIDGGADSGRTVGTALFVLRNKVDATGNILLPALSVGTVYRTDDLTSAWTFSMTTGGFPISSVDPLL